MGDVKPRVAVLDDYQDVARAFGPWDRLEGEVELTVFTEWMPEEERVERLEPFDLIVAMRERTPFPRTLLERLPNLKLLVTTGPGNAAIDMAAARELGIVVSGTGGPRASTMELTWALLLAVSRHVVAEDRAIREGGWQHTIGPELAGRTLGLVGLGKIGSRMAAIANAFEMRVLAWSQNLTPGRAEAAGAEAVSKERLLAESDFVSIHVVLSKRTRGLLGAEELALMKPTAYLVNTSRGPIVDEQALLAALRDGTIAGAGLDVFNIEPLPRDHPFRSAPNTVLTPHIGYVATGVYESWYREVVEDIAGFLRGEPVRVLNDA
jgi:phosphoglycerate dehydrogenase-like enzyme